MRAWIRELLETVFPDVTWRWELEQTLRDKDAQIEQLNETLNAKTQALARLKAPAIRIPVEDDGHAARVRRNAMTDVGKDARGAAASIPKLRMTHLQGAPRAGKPDPQRAAERREASAEAVASFTAGQPALSNNAIAEMARTMGKRAKGPSE